MQDSNFDRIHNINPWFNKFLSQFLLIAGIFVTVLLLLLPYYGRVALALLINIFFNRPLVYLNYLGKLIAKPLHLIQVSIFYYTLFGMFSIFYKFFTKTKHSGWSVSSPNTQKTNMRFQS